MPVSEFKPFLEGSKKQRFYETHRRHLEPLVAFGLGAVAPTVNPVFFDGPLESFTAHDAAHHSSEWAVLAWYRAKNGVPCPLNMARSAAFAGIARDLGYDRRASTLFDIRLAHSGDRAKDMLAEAVAATVSLDFARMIGFELDAHRDLDRKRLQRHVFRHVRWLSRRLRHPIPVADFLRVFRVASIYEPSDINWPGTAMLRHFAGLPVPASATELERMYCRQALAKVKAAGLLDIPGHADFVPVPFGRDA